MAQGDEATPLGKDWSCLQVQRPPSPLVTIPAGASRLVQSLQVLSLANGEVPPNVRVRACPARDVDCANPLTDNISVDLRGWVDLPLYEGFDGFLEITGETVVSTLLFYSDPLRPNGQVDKTPLGLVEKDLLPGLSGATGTQQDPALGLVYLRAFDCQGVAAPGVTFSIDRPGWRWYFVGALPSASAEETADTGLGGFINVAPGVAVVDARLPSENLAIATPKSVLVRANWMTGLRFIANATP